MCNGVIATEMAKEEGACPNTGTTPAKNRRQIAIIQANSVGNMIPTPKLAHTALATLT